MERSVQNGQQAALIREEVASLLQEWLAGTMRARALRETELTQLAKELVTANEPPNAENAP